MARSCVLYMLLRAPLKPKERTVVAMVAFVTDSSSEVSVALEFLALVA